MALIEIHLQEGWDGDHVEILIDGNGWVDQHSVTTDYSLGLAWMERISVQAGRHQVEVVLPDRELVARLSVDVDDELYLGIVIEGDRISFVTQAEGFSYF
ncbi:MAG: hypothetical protein ACR2QK_01580 [Acidimicrobiales bacterium]